MSTRRYCRRCKEETLHDASTDIWGFGQGTGRAERAFMALVTVGLSEASADRAFVCQCCGTRVKRR